MGNITWLERLQWGAGPVTLGYSAPHEQFVRLVIHHTVVPYGGDPVAYMRRLQTSRPDLGLEVPYSFIVMPGATEHDAIIGVGRGWCRTGAHTVGHNSTAYGIALAGDFTESPPTPGMLAAIRLIGSHLKAPQATLGHRDTYATACPGNATYPLLGDLQPPFQPLSEQEPDVQLTDKTTTGYTVNDILNWTIDGVNRLNARLDGIEASLAALNSKPLASFAGEGLKAADVADAVLDALRDELND